MDKLSLFEKYSLMIRRRAHEYSQSFGIDYSELESQGFLIYCECLEKYDAEKSSFSTYLYIQLNRLKDYCKTYVRQQGVLINDYYGYSVSQREIADKDFELTLEAKKLSPKVSDFLEEAKQELSSNAYKLLLWILKREWEMKGKRKPTVLMATQYFKTERKNVEKVWDEIGRFWNKTGFAFYA